MNIYHNTPKTHQERVRAVIAKQPTAATRRRETHTDTFRAGQVQTFAFTCTAAPFRLSRGSSAFEEKGSVASAPFVMTTADVPYRLPGNPPIAPFLIEDIITTAAGERYRVTAPPRYYEGCWELNVDLQG